MFFQRLKSPGLAQHSYVVGCGEGQAVVVDPRRDIAEYLDLTREHGLTIAYVLATHRQAYLDAIRAYNAEGKPARTWPIQFLVRRTAHHVMDHAWELEDRDPASLKERP